MMTLKFILPILATIPMLASGDSLSQNQKQEVKSLIAETLKEQPKLVIDAIIEFKKDQMAQYQKNTESKIAKNTDDIFNKNNDLVLGNPKGSTTIVEFVDYNCGHCKALSKTLQELIATNSDVKIIVKEIPIFGASSELAAQAAVASSKQDKFSDYHYGLMTSNNKPDENSLLTLAKNKGLNLEKFKSDMNSKTTKEYIQDNLKLAGRLDIMATPALIITKGKKNVFFAGALPLENLNNIIRDLQ